jgi:hypothetical protein
MKTFFQLRAILAVASVGPITVVLLAYRRVLEDYSKTNLNIVTFP